MFEYNRWADERLLTACGQLTDEQYAREIGGSFPSIRATVAHHAGALRAWGTRFEGGEVTSLPSEAEVPDAETAMRLVVEGHETLVREARQARRGVESDLHVSEPSRNHGQPAALGGAAARGESRDVSPRADCEHDASGRRGAAVDRLLPLGDGTARRVAGPAVQA